MSRSSSPAAAAGILGVGSCLPPTIRTNDFWPPAFSRRDEDQRRRDVLAIDRRASGEATTMAPEIAEAQARHSHDPFKGSIRRHVITDDEQVSDLEAEAGRRALADARLPVEAVDALLVHSLTPDLLHPSNAPAVQDKCGLTRAVAIAVDNGCCSSHVMLSLAASMVQSGAYRHVLCVASSAASRTVDLMHPASPIFGDGASAFVVGPVPPGYGVMGQFLRTDGSFRDAVVNATMVDGKPERDWYRHQGPIRLASFDPDRARETGLLQVDLCREASAAALSRAGLSVADVAFFLGPQTLPWLNGALVRALNIPDDRTIDTFTEVANLGSSTLTFNLERAVRGGRLHNGDVLLTYSPGAGLTRAALVLRWWRGDPL
jgi:3-oxoacyl-[acyl-carrier-protein] synthase-3